MKSALACLAALPGLIAATPVYASSAGEAAAAAAMDAAAASPISLRIFLKSMPKGGDLHNHAGGTPWAEHYIAWAQEKGFCLNVSTSNLSPPPCAEGEGLETQDPFAFARLVDALSMRGLQRGVAANDVTGHTQFFSSFKKFGAVAMASTPNVLATVRRIAAGDNATYVELMHNPNAFAQFMLAPEATGSLRAEEFEARFQRDMKVLGPVLEKAIAELDGDEAQARKLLGCGDAAQEPGCSVAVHYLASGFRAFEPGQVFRSLLAGFALADRDPRFLGVNIVQPEDWPISLRDYDLHMEMYRFLEAKYPRVRRTMHAGELALGLVPPEHLRNHIAKALDGGAERIGHGTAIAYEDDAEHTLRRMATDGIAVEINLSSNDVILGVRGPNHPLSLYRRFSVPVVLSTDDQGILRTDLTNEYVRAVSEQGLGYRDLKEIARSSLEYSFLPGASIWSAKHIGELTGDCRKSMTASKCKALVQASEKARLQSDLEQRFDRFEARYLDAANNNEK